MNNDTFISYSVSSNINNIGLTARIRDIHIEEEPTGEYLACITDRYADGQATCQSQVFVRMPSLMVEESGGDVEAVLFDAENGDDRLLIVIQGLKGLELSAKYAEMFADKGYSSLAMSYYGGEGQPKTMRAIPLEQFRTACDTLKRYENGRFCRFGIYGNSKGAGMALLAASVVPDISLVIAASSFGHIMQGSGGKNLSPCKAMVSIVGKDFPYVPNKGVFGAFVKRCVKEHNVRLLYFFDEWERKGTVENEIPVETINGDILFLTSTNDESVPAKRDAEMLISRLQRMGFAHSYRHINFENGSHNLGYFPINNNMLPQEKKHPAQCQKAREDALEIILQTLDKWSVRQL